MRALRTRPPEPSSITWSRSGVSLPGSSGDDRRRRETAPSEGSGGHACGRPDPRLPGRRVFFQRAGRRRRVMPGEYLVPLAALSPTPLVTVC